MHTTLLADDLTGACDAGAPFAGRSRVGVFVAPASPGAEWNVAAVDTETRAVEPREAAGGVRAAAGRLGTRLTRGLLFKKVDSTLRGAVGAELEALLSASGRPRALLCPAFPDQRRTVVRGTLLVGGAPAHRSPVGRDPAYPGSTSDVAEIVRGGALRPVCVVTLDRVRAGREALARALDGGGERIIVADAETDADLEALAGAALAAPELVLAGSAGLAGAVAAAVGCAGPPVALSAGRAWLIVAGSLHPATRAQIDALEAAGVKGLRLDDDARDPGCRVLVEAIRSGHPAFITTGEAACPTLPARAATASRLAEAAARVLAGSHPDLIVATGGETALALFRAVGAERLELAGAPASGLALGEAIVGAGRALPLLTKAGGFGAPDLLLTLLG